MPDKPIMMLEPGNNDLETIVINFQSGSVVQVQAAAKARTSGAGKSMGNFQQHIVTIDGDDLDPQLKTDLETLVSQVLVLIVAKHFA